MEFFRWPAGFPRELAFGLLKIALKASSSESRKKVTTTHFQ